MDWGLASSGCPTITSAARQVSLFDPGDQILLRHADQPKLATEPQRERARAHCLSFLIIQIGFTLSLCGISPFFRKLPGLKILVAPRAECSATRPRRETGCRSPRRVSP